MPKGELHSVQGDGLSWNPELRKAYAELYDEIGQNLGAKKKPRRRVNDKGRLKNWPEQRLWSQLTKEGWTVTKRGWPDFFCERDGEILLVEVKPNWKEELRPSQLKICRALKAAGIPVKRWSPDQGFREIK